MPDRNKRFIKKEKTNQYINETELKSLMIRINNKSFIENLSSKFKRLDKYLNNHKTADKAFRFILEKYSINCISKIITNKYKQLLLLSDDELKNFKKMIIEYNAVQRDMTLYTDEFNKKNTEVFNNIIDEFNKVLIEMTVKNKNLITRKTDSIKLEKYISKHTKSKSQKYKRLLREYIVLISERNVIDKKSFDKKVWKSYNLEELEKELYYIDNVFESSNKVFNFIRPLFNFIIRRLWQKKKEK